jgi:hypothetical protein
VAINRKWSWSAFLSCPVWSIYHGFHGGAFSAYILVLMCFLLFFAKSNFPVLSQFSSAILLAILLVEYLLYFPVSSLLTNTSKIFGLEVDKMVGILVPALFYVCYCIYIGIVSGEWLERNKSTEELFMIKNNDKKWIVFGILTFIPTNFIFNYILWAILNETMRSFGP